MEDLTLLDSPALDEPRKRCDQCRRPKCACELLIRRKGLAISASLLAQAGVCLCWLS